MVKKYDFLVIGGGAAGYSAALKASAKLKTAIIEEKEIGGTCLNRGCIPTKKFRWIANNSNRIHKKSEIEEEINKTVDVLRKGLENKIKNAGIDIYYGHAIASKDDRKIIIIRENGDKLIFDFDFLLIATGAEPNIPEVCDKLFHNTIARNHMFTSDDAFKADNILPDSILIIGGGIVGVEFASIYQSLGVDVTIIETERRIISNFSKDISRTITKIFKSRGMNILTGYRVVDIQEEDDEMIVTISQSNDSEKTKEILVGKILVAVGRKPRLCSELLDNLGVLCFEEKICVDKNNKTSIDNIFAAGDVCSDLQLAYQASFQGEKIAGQILNRKGHNDVAEQHTDEKLIPICIFANPEAAQIGVCEDDIGAENEKYSISKYSLKANGMSVLQECSEGYVKLIALKKSKVIVGAELVCANAVEIIMLCKSWINEKKMTDDILCEVFPHPSVAESLKEAAKGFR